MSRESDIERRRQAWIAFMCSSLSGYEPWEDDEEVEDIAENCAIIADAALEELDAREEEGVFEVEVAEEAAPPKRRARGKK